MLSGAGTRVGTSPRCAAASANGEWRMQRAFRALRPLTPSPSPTAHPDPRERGAREIHRHLLMWPSREDPVMAGATFGKNVQAVTPPSPGGPGVRWERGRG